MAAADEGAHRLLGSGGWSDARILRPSAALLILNLLDGVFTLAFLQLGVAREVNPLMRAAYLSSPVLFMFVKLAAVHGGVALLASHASARPARAALWLGAWCYAAIVAYHLAFLVHLF